MKRKDRLFTIKKLVLNHNIATQQELMEHLQKENIQTTQATLSRDIKELNLIKVTQIGRTTKYTFFHDAFHEKSLYYRLESALHNYALSITRVNFFVVLFIRPNHPRIIASLIDELKIPAIAGTIANFDTCLIIMKTEQDAHLLADCFTDILNDVSVDELEKRIAPLFNRGSV